MRDLPEATVFFPGESAPRHVWLLRHIDSGIWYVRGVYNSEESAKEAHQSLIDGGVSHLLLNIKKMQTEVLE